MTYDPGLLDGPLDDEDVTALRREVRAAVREEMAPIRQFFDSFESMMKKAIEVGEKLERLESARKARIK